MTIKGYSDQQKTGGGAGGTQQFATVNPVREQQNAIDVMAHMFHQVVGTDTAETGSTTTVVKATSHAAQVGDAISFTAGNLAKNEYRVKSIVDADNIQVSETMSEAPANGDAFSILRPKYPKVTDAGELDVSTTLSNDTNYGAVGANTLRTGAQIGNATGAASFGAGNVGAQVLRTTPAADSAHLLSTRHEAAATPLSARLSDGSAFYNGATETTVAAIKTAVEIIDNAIAGSEMQVDVITLPALPAGSNNIGDVDVLSLPALPAGSNNIGDVDVLTLPALPTGANTIGSVGVTNLPATVDTDSGAAGASTPRSVLATRHEAAATPVSVRISDGSAFAPLATAGKASVLNVNQDISALTTAAYVQVSASTSAAINWLSAFESSGNGVILAVGAAASEVDVLYIPPGGFGHAVPLSIASGSRVSIKAMLGNNSSGQLIMNLLN